jgi:hypothetical protein
VKVTELLLEKKSAEDKRLYARASVQLKRDYVRWKRIINMPTKTMKALLTTKEGDLAGFTPKELKRLKQQKYRQPFAAILHMRSTAVNEWTTEDINWMYRQLNFVEKLRFSQGALRKDGEATEKLITLWAWGHLPGGMKSNKVDL